MSATRNFSIPKAHAAQKCMSRKIVAEDRLPPRINLIAGVDVAYAGDHAVGATAVADYTSLKLLELQTSACEVKFPYIPTLLYLREIQPALASIKKLRLQPDVFLVDAQGVAHPYGCGFASHLGFVLGKPTVGVEKSRLFGEPVEIGGEIFLVHEDQIVGAIVKPREDGKPVTSALGIWFRLGQP